MKTAMFVCVFAVAMLVAPTSGRAQTCGSTKMWLPDDVTVTSMDEESLEVLSDSYTYVAHDVGGGLQMVAGAGITCSCKCTAGGGTCSPSIFKGDCSCTAKNHCTACSLTTGSAATGGLFTDGGYLNFALGVSFVRETIEDAPATFPAMFELPEVQNAITEFTDLVYMGGEIPDVVHNADGTVSPLDGYLFAPISIFGRILFMPVPSELIAAGLAAAANGSCKCTDGGCAFDSSWTPKGTLYYCDGNCKGTCTLSMSAARDFAAFPVDRWDFVNYAY